MLNRSLWLQRRLAQPSRARRPSNWCGDLASIDTAHRGITTQGRACAPAKRRPDYTHNTALGQLETDAHNSSLQLQLERNDRFRKSSTTSRPISLRALDLRSGQPTVSCEPTKRFLSTAQNIATDSQSFAKQRARRKHSVYHGSPEDRAHYAMRMVMYRRSKSRHNIWDTESDKTSIKLIRNSLARPLNQRASRSPREHDAEEGDIQATLLSCQRPSPLAKGGYVSKLDSYLSYWAVASQRIFTRYDQPWNGSLDSTSYWRFSIEMYARRHGLASTLSTDPAGLWRMIPKRKKNRHWMSMLLYTLQHNPIVASEILRQMLAQRDCQIPVYIAEDCVLHVCTALLQPYPDRTAKGNFKKPTASDITICKKTIHAYLSYAYRPFGSVTLSERILTLVTRWFPLSDLRKILEELATQGFKLDVSSIRRLVYRYTKENEVDEALGWLSHIPLEERATDKVLELCVFMLRFNFANTDDLYRLRTRIISTMLEIGIRPNRRMHDVVILNALEAGDRQTAWGSHQIITENGVPATAFTYSILLKGIDHGDGIDALSAIYRQSLEDGILTRSPVLAGSMIHALYRVDELNHRPRPFRRMLKVYAGVFDLEPLHYIGIGLEAKQTNPEGVELMTPPDKVMGSMVIAWLSEHVEDPELDEVYARFMYALQHRTSRIAILGHDRKIFNAFIIAFSRRLHSLKDCTSVVQIMQDPERYLGASPTEFSSPNTYLRKQFSNRYTASSLRRLARNSSAGSVVHNDGETDHVGSWYIKIPRPDWKTWNILLYAFMRNGEAGTAAKILDNMKGLGIDPTDSTWNSLISGYARLDMVEGVVASVQRKTEAGYEQDSWTLNALQRVQSRKLLLAAFGQADAQAGRNRPNNEQIDAMDRSNKELLLDPEEDGGDCRKLL